MQLISDKVKLIIENEIIKNIYLNILKHSGMLKLYSLRFNLQLLK